VVEDAFVAGFYPVVFENLVGVRGQRAFEIAKNVANGLAVIFRKRFGIGSRIGDDLVLFVKSLGDAEGFSGGKSETAVGFALKRGEIVKAAGGLAGALF